MLLYAHTAYSKGAKLLARELRIRRIKHKGSRFSGRRRPLVINWGYSGPTLPWEERVRWLNHPRAVERVSNKLTFFQLMANRHVEHVPPWVVDQEIAQEWWDDGMVVVERHHLRGSSGSGIRIAEKETGDILHPAPLYTQYVKKAGEFRIHISGEEIIDRQKKVKKAEAINPDFRIRTHANGFIYQREGIDVPDAVVIAAQESMAATGLDFGAVDVIWNAKKERALVLEVNTAPGLEGTTVVSYANVFRGLR